MKNHHAVVAIVAVAAIAVGGYAFMNDSGTFKGSFGSMPFGSRNESPMKQAQGKIPLSALKVKPGAPVVAGQPQPAPVVPTRVSVAKTSRNSATFTVVDAGGTPVDLPLGYSLGVAFGTPDARGNAVAMSGIDQVYYDANGQNPIYPIIRRSAGTYSVNFPFAAGSYTVSLYNDNIGQLAAGSTEVVFAPIPLAAAESKPVNDRE